MTLSDEQLAAAQSSADIPLLILAGPGSGKTTTLVHRISYLSPSLSSNESILLLTFSKSAVHEMSSRLSMHSILEAQCHVFTFHSFALRIIKAHHVQAGYLKPPRVMTLKERLELLRGCISSLRSIDVTQSQDDKKVLSETLRFISEIKRSTDPGKTLEDYKDSYKELFYSYQRRLIETNRIEFEDMVPTALKMLRHHSQLLSHYQRLYRYVLCDEFQDTNTYQRQMLLLLGASGRITAVGDMNQLIYAFQGADVNNFKCFKSYFKATHAVSVMSLSRNFRSSGPIVYFCNTLIDESSEDLPATSMVPLKDREEGCKVEIVECLGSSDSELQFLTNKIMELLRDKRVNEASDMAILCRTNDSVQRVGRFIRERCSGIQVTLSLTADDEGNNPASMNY